MARQARIVNGGVSFWTTCPYGCANLRDDAAEEKIEHALSRGCRASAPCFSLFAVGATSEHMAPSVRKRPAAQTNSARTKAVQDAGDSAGPVVKRPASAGRRSISRGGQPAELPNGIGTPELLNAGGMDLRQVLIIYTGGTIGMQDTGGGSLGPVPGALVERLRELNELAQQRMPRCFLVEFDPIVDSADMRPTDWNAIATVIESFYYEYDGFVVLHGTDTMAYTASALSFMLEELAKPVVLTGSQLPFFEPLSDARQNFLGATTFAGLADISEVCVYFSGQLLRGNRAYKGNAVSLQAFISPNYPCLAELGTEIRLYRRRIREPPRGRFRLHLIKVIEILVVWVIPGFSDDFLSALARSGTVKGLVLMLYGCGNAPAHKESFLKHLRDLIGSGVVVAACSQCLKGTVSLQKYAVAKALDECGVVSAGDMTTEAAVTKLAYILSKGVSPEQARKAMSEDLRGEITTEVTTLRVHEPTTRLTAF